jgi:metal-responsive CopG/Arc/MetJ family transcriptional regulator
MHSLAQLQKQQVGLRLPTYLVEQIDELTKEYNLNRTDIIIESIKSYIDEQKTKEFYKNFDSSCKELKEVLNDPKKINELQSIEDFLDKH